MSSLAFNLSASTSSSLLARVKSRDEDAWRRLSKLYGPLVYRATRRFGLQEFDAAEIVQEVFQSVFLHIDGFRRDRQGDTFRGWLWTITKTKLLDYYRKRARQPPVEGGSDAYDRLRNVPEELLEDDSSGAALASASALAQYALALIQTDFEEKTWQAFWRSAVEDKPAAEIAAELEMTVAAVYKAKSRVLARLRAELSDL